MAITKLESQKATQVFQAIEKSNSLSLDNKEDVVGILGLKVLKNIVEGGRPFQQNKEDVVNFFPSFQRIDDYKKWQYSLDANCSEGLGKIVLYPYSQNKYEYYQIKFENGIHDLKRTLNIDDWIVFLKFKSNPEYKVYRLQESDFTDLFDYKNFVCILNGDSDDTTFAFDSKSKLNSSIEPLNLDVIYYGPPGTGKTREIQLNHLAGRDDSNSKFITFHQSYSYEEFIEGLKPIVIHGKEQIHSNDKLNNFVKESLCILLADLGWNVISKNIQEVDSKIEGKSFRGLRLTEYFGACNLFGKFDEPQSINSLKSGNVVRFHEEPFVENEQETIYLSTQWTNNEVDGLTYKNYKSFIFEVSDGVYSVECKGNEYQLSRQSDLKSNIIYKIIKGVFYEACESSARLAGYNSLKECVADTIENRALKMKQAIENNNTFVLCIDEINRANISSVFGDLITLIESNKRLGNSEEMISTLPYSKDKFGVPNNLQIVGSMNTADRSITLLDSALRRRFKFIEILPNPSILKNIAIDNIFIDLSKILNTINKRINYFLGKDQAIGHSYFISLENSSTPKKDLLSIFFNNIIPLLEEYFYNDISKIRLVLGENNKSNTDLKFYNVEEGTDLNTLFGSNIEDSDIGFDDDTQFFTKSIELLEFSLTGEEEFIDSKIFSEIYK